MNRNDKKTGKDRNVATDAEPLSNDKHNPFKDTEVNQNTGATPDEEAIAEQQRKEALTERD
jgi:hypothetical protein